jgi:alpha-galactosidase
MKKITFIGGGSAKFVREVAVDLFSFPELQDIHLTLMDIDAERANRSRRLIEKMISERKLPATATATTDRRAALEGADYVIVTVMVGGLEHYQSDVAIPAKYGVFQTVSDTIGPGGVFRTVRTAPVLRKIVQDLKEVAPHACVLNYANPMAMNCWTFRECGWSNVVGLCHSIQHTYRAIGRWLDIPHVEIVYTAGGINHIDFYLKLEHKGEDLYPRLKAAAARIVAEQPQERARFELLEYLGHFPAEGPYHQTEYYPWFAKSDEAVKHYATPAYWGYNVDSQGFHNRTIEVEEQIAGTRPIRYERSLEYGAWIIHSLEANVLRSFYGNVPNDGLIPNLPAEAIVEVPCFVDSNGIVAGKVGPIPPQLAAVMAPHIAVHGMAVQGTLTGDEKLIRQAIQADPLTAAVLTLPRINEMVDELFEENRDYFPVLS